jgi:hypothetical protein
MNLDFALLAEAATPAEGKQFIHGAGLRRIDAPQLPWPDDVLVDFPPFHITVPTPQPDSDELVAQVAVEMAVAFAVEGWYRFVLEFDDEPLTQLRLRIRRVELPTESGPSGEAESDA